MPRVQNRWFRPRDPLFRLLLVNGLGGAALGLVFVAGVVALDIGQLRGLLRWDGTSALALGLLAFGGIITFGSVAMGSAIMRIDPEDRDGRGPPARPAATDVPIAVRATARFD